MHNGFIKRSGKLIAVFASAIVIASILSPVLPGDDQPAYPWTKGELLDPAALAQSLNSPKGVTSLFCVAFPTLYKQRHILHAQYAGPGNTPEGIELLKQAVAKLTRDSEVIIYCGCCPMVRCPNLQPAYRTLKEMGFTNIRVLEIPTNLLTDWTSKGYPVE